MFIVINFLLIK